MDTTRNTKFSDIRAYNNSEVDKVLQQIYRQETLHKALLKVVFPHIKSKTTQNLLLPFFRIYSKYQIARIHNIEDFQNQIRKFLKLIIKHTTSQIHISGLENLDDKPALFISNHRDIVFDPALINYALFTHGFNTTRIAIGDNLLKNQIVEDLMRLNKSFIVKRSIKGIKENLLAMKLLSEYINLSITQDLSSVWLAQRQGRAKNGIDSTDKAVLKMLRLAHKSDQEFSENIANLNIVPVSISYEFDPCDYLKAKELQCFENKQEYTKTDDEDINSIITGLMGFKGNIYINFTTPLNQDEANKAKVCDIGTLAAYLDKQINKNYQIQPSNLIAKELILNTDINKISKEQNANIKYIENFKRRLAKHPEDLRKIILQIYANPVLNKEITKI